MNATRTIHTFFAGLDKRQATEAELAAAGITRGAADRAVREGDLRRGVSGYWLPRPPDPGATAVMQRAMRVTEASEQ